jgi:hypothetical protein
MLTLNLNFSRSNRKFLISKYKQIIMYLAELEITNFRKLREALNKSNKHSETA